MPLPRTNSVKQSASWETNRFSASQEIPGMWWNQKIQYGIHKRQPLLPSPRPWERFCKIVNFYGEKFLAPLPTPKLEDNLLSARDCLLNTRIFAATLHIWRPKPVDLPSRGNRDPLVTALPRSLPKNHTKTNYILSHIPQLSTRHYVLFRN